MILPFRVVLVVLACVCGTLAAQSKDAPGGSSGAVPTSVPCVIDSAEPSGADVLLASEAFREAEAAYRQTLEKQPNLPEARLGIVRALIGQDRVEDASAEAGRMLREQPKSSVTEVAISEVAYRMADINGAFAHAKTALTENKCEGRAALALARLYDLTGLYATAAHMKALGHALRPKDELIYREWLQSLPRVERQAELAKYLGGKPALSGDDARSYGNELKHLEARKPGECHISSKTEQTQTPMQLVFGDRHYPVAFGLDVLFDGKRRRMQIDTGASGIVLTENAARGLGMQQEYHVKSGGVGDEGERDSYLTHVHSIRIGDVEVQDCMVEVIAKSKLDVDGLIGMDVFDRWLVTLDYQRAQLRLGPLPTRPESTTNKPGEASGVTRDKEQEGIPKDRYVAPEMKDWLSVARIGHQIMLPASLKMTSPLHYLIMDTGASSSTLSLPLAKEAGKLHSSNTQFTGISGKMNHVYETDRTGLLVGTLSLPPEEYYAFDMTKLSHSSGFETGGLLGLPTLQRLTIQIDYRDNLLKLSYDPKQDFSVFSEDGCKPGTSSIIRCTCLGRWRGVRE